MRTFTTLPICTWASLSRFGTAETELGMSRPKWTPKAPRRWAVGRLSPAKPNKMDTELDILVELKTHKKVRIGFILMVFGALVLV